MSSRGGMEAIYNSILTSDPRGLFSAFFDSVFGNIAAEDGSQSSVHNAQSVVTEYSGKAAIDKIGSIYKESLRVEVLVLHSVREGVKPSSHYPAYNIILHRPPTANAPKKEPKTMFSVFRCESEGEALRVFKLYRQLFPDLVKASATTGIPVDKPMIEKILQMLFHYESYSAAHIAAALNMVEPLKSPVFHGKLVGIERKFLHTPLEVACVHGNFQAFQAILNIDNETSLEHLRNHVDFQGNSVVHLAAACKDPEAGAKIMKLIKQKILQLAGAQMVDVLVDLFQKQNTVGFSPIHLACIGQNLGAAEELSSVSDHSDKTQPGSPNLLDIKDSKGYTCLHFVTTNPVMLSHLLSLGADPNIPDNDGLTPLHKAVVMKELQSTLHLLANKADPNPAATLEKYMSVTPLHLAAGVCDVDYMRALLAHGAKKELKDGNGHTPKDLVDSAFPEDPTAKGKALAVLFAGNLEGNSKEIAGLHQKLAIAEVKK